MASQDGTEVTARRKPPKKRQCQLPDEAKEKKFRRIDGSKDHEAVEATGTSLASSSCARTETCIADQTTTTGTTALSPTTPSSCSAPRNDAEGMTPAPEQDANAGPHEECTENQNAHRFFTNSITCKNCGHDVVLNKEEENVIVEMCS